MPTTSAALVPENPCSLTVSPCPRVPWLRATWPRPCLSDTVVVTTVWSTVSAGEVVGVDVLDEVPELLQDLVFALVVARGGHLAGLVEHLLGGEDRRAGAHREGDGVGLKRRHDVVAISDLEVELGVERVLDELGDGDTHERRAELGDDRL